MKTKKIAAVLLTYIMAIGLMAGCGASNTKTSLLLIMTAILQVQTSLEMKKRIQIPENTTDTTENTSTGNGKPLVCILFSFRKYKRCC